MNLEPPAALGLQGVHGQLHLTGGLLRQDDRLVEEDVLHSCRRPSRGQRHRCVGRAGNDHRAVDDVMGQPGLGLDRQHRAVDGVAGREIPGTAEDPRSGATVGPDAGDLGPVTAALERVGGQLQRAGRRVLPGGEVRSMSTGVGRCERFGHLALGVGSLAQGHDGARSGRGFRPDLQRGGAEDGLGTDFHQDRAPQRGDRRDTLGELDRLTGMLAPVLGVQGRLGAQHRTGSVADQWQGRCCIAESPREGLEFVEHRIEQLGVERVRSLQPSAAGAVLTAGRDDLFQILAGPGEHRVAAVVGADRNTREGLGGLKHIPGVGEHGDHAAAGRQTAEEPSALGDEPGPVLEAEHPGHAGGRVLADAVAQNHVGFDTPRLPQPRQAHFDGEDRRLGKRRVPQRFRSLAVTGQQDVKKRAGQDRVDRLGAPADGVGEHRLGVEQLAGHAEVLATLTGEEPRGSRGVGAFAA